MQSTLGLKHELASIEHEHTEKGLADLVAISSSPPYRFLLLQIYRGNAQLNVYERPLVLVDADRHTREFYANNGIRLGEPVLPVQTPEPVFEPPILPPSVDSFTEGDDDDDFGSRSTSLIPSPPRKIRGEDVMFRYNAELK